LPGTLTATCVRLTCDLTPPYLLARLLLACLFLARVLVWWLRVAGCGLTGRLLVNAGSGHGWCSCSLYRGEWSGNLDRSCLTVQERGCSGSVRVKESSESFKQNPDFLRFHKIGLYNPCIEATIASNTGEH
tara:strand:+ start:63 stop:455 length:393 start_codon:yes stop_codon:yes gene_type:complete